MAQVAVGTTVPDISLHLTGGREAGLRDFRDKPLVLYFYPRASTPGCTQEGLDFTAANARFRRLSCRILGASRDGLRAQENFKVRHGFPFELVADKDETLCTAFDVIRIKQLYGKQVRGIERSTFLIDADGVLRQEWRGVKVKGHVEQVLEAVKSLQQ